MLKFDFELLNLKKGSVNFFTYKNEIFYSASFLEKKEDVDQSRIEFKMT